jgi:hypothetical protein
MPPLNTARRVRETLCDTFAQLDVWFDRDESLRARQPTSGRWSISAVLEHVALTNYFLMLTLRKWATIADERVARGDPIPAGESDLDRLLVIGERGSFGWERPEHMEPTGVPTAAEMRARLHQQLGECLILLERMADGRGSLCHVTMTVNDLGKIDLYQWLFFLAQHARRHLQQLASIENEVAGIPTEVSAAI